MSQKVSSVKKEVCLLCKSRIDINEDCENCGSKWDFSIIETIDETLKVLFNREKKLNDDSYRRKYLSLYKTIEKTIPSEIGLIGQAAIGVSINSLVSQSTNNYLSFLEDINLEAKKLKQKKVRKNFKQYKSEDRAEFFASFIGSLFIVFICSWGFKNMPTGLMNDSYLLTTLFFVLKWIFIYPLMGVFLIVGSLCAPYFFFKMFMPTKNSKEIKIANIELIDNDLENLQSKLIKNIPLFKELLL